MAITELTHDNSKLVNFLEKHDYCPILSDPANTRVGLAFPKLLKDKVEVIDAWNYSEKRAQNSQIACQITTYKVSLVTSCIFISATYIVPSASKEAFDAMCNKISSLCMDRELFIAAGDFNKDQHKKENRDYFKNFFSGILSQKVKKTTRHSVKVVKNRTIITNTCIDLVFVSDKLKKKCLDKEATICKDTPSDHYCPSLSFDVKVPYKYIVKEYYLDPTRRPPIPKDKLNTIILELRNKFDLNSAAFEDMNQADKLDFITKTTKE